jgi:hypothetical protein
MNIFETIFSSGIKPVFEGIGGLAKDIRTAITGKDPVKMAEIEQKAMEIEAMSQQAQVAVNLEEAKHPNIFVSGWRPFCGWVCGFGLAYHYIMNPLIAWAIKLYRPDLTPPPSLDVGDLLVLLSGMLGFGLYRSYEKTKDVQGNH